MQNTQFTHGKCTVCGHLAKIDSFNHRRDNEVKQTNSDGSTYELYNLVLICPICTSEFCEALFPNELN